MCDVLLLNSVATNYPTTYKGEKVIEILELMFNDHEAIVKDKDELIELCKQENTNLSAKCWGYVNKLKKKDTKARSIVAMLFKHWKHYSRIRCRMYSDDTIETSKTLYKKARQILKDNA